MPTPPAAVAATKAARSSSGATPSRSARPRPPPPTSPSDILSREEEGAARREQRRPEPAEAQPDRPDAVEQKQDAHAGRGQAADQRGHVQARRAGTRHPATAPVQAAFSSVVFPEWNPPRWRSPN